MEMTYRYEYTGGEQVAFDEYLNGTFIKHKI